MQSVDNKERKVIRVLKSSNKGNLVFISSAGKPIDPSDIDKNIRRKSVLEIKCDVSTINSSPENQKREIVFQTGFIIQYNGINFTQRQEKFNDYNEFRKYRQSNKNKRYSCSLICGKQSRNITKNDFEYFVRNVLRKENVSPYNYHLSYVKYSIFIDFVYQEDMVRVLCNHKYEQIGDTQICFNKKYKKSDEKTLYINGIPKGITRKELDNILTESYKLRVHEVTKIIPSYEYENLMFAHVHFDYAEDALVCYNTLKEIKGYAVDILLPNSNDLTSHSSSDVNN